jgi:hypothetical protein
MGIPMGAQDLLPGTFLELSAVAKEGWALADDGSNIPATDVERNAHPLQIGFEGMGRVTPLQELEMGADAQGLTTVVPLRRFLVEREVDALSPEARGQSGAVDEDSLAVDLVRPGTCAGIGPLQAEIEGIPSVPETFGFERRRTAPLGVEGEGQDTETRADQRPFPALISRGHIFTIPELTAEGKRSV